MVELLANRGDPNQTRRSVANRADPDHDYLGLHCLPATRLGVFRLRFVNGHSFNVYLFFACLFILLLLLLFVCCCFFFFFFFFFFFLNIRLLRRCRKYFVLHYLILKQKLALP